MCMLLEILNEMDSIIPVSESDIILYIYIYSSTPIL
jgi:hypothetical protein